MLAAFASSTNPDDPVSALEVGDLPAARPPQGWADIEVLTASLNHHDVWALRGFGLRREQLPMILGCDAAGLDAEGNEVIVHALVGDPTWHGDETIDPSRTILSEHHPGTFAERLTVPTRNLVRKPPSLTWEEAACLPTAYLTAYRMLFGRSGLQPGQTVLVQGAGGGVASAAITLGAAAGIEVWAVSRSERKRELAVELGAHATFEPGARLPSQVDAVVETVGAATWEHSLKALKPGARLILAGSTSGANPPADLFRIFLKQIEIVGTTMGTLADLEGLVHFLEVSGVRPRIDRILPLATVAEGVEAMVASELTGKVVLRTPAFESRQGKEPSWATSS